MIIRLGFVGASGTGKTTLAKQFAEELKLPFCDIGSREIAKQMGFDNPYDVDAAGQRAEFQQRLLSAKTAWEAQRLSTGFVTDRTHLDNYVYTLMHAPKQAKAYGFRALIARSMQAYTHIVFCKIQSFHNLANDPARVSEMGYHERFEEEIEELFHQPNGKPVIWLNSHILHLSDPDTSRRAHHVRRLLEQE